MRENYTLKRLYCDQALSLGAVIVLPKEQVHYLATVLRMDAGKSLRLFNGRDGEWRGEILSLTKRKAEVTIVEALRETPPMADIVLAFAPVRRHRTAFIFEKGTELGAARFDPIITARTQFPKLNAEKAQAQIIEAAEQTERLDVPKVNKVSRLLDWLPLQNDRALIFADESGDARPAAKVLAQISSPATLLIGPEGGFTDEERHILRAMPNVTPVCLGPRILRADTAALALLTLWQAVNGDWGRTLLSTQGPQ